MKNLIINWHLFIHIFASHFVWRISAINWHGSKSTAAFVSIAGINSNNKTFAVFIFVSNDHFAELPFANINSLFGYLTQISRPDIFAINKVRAENLDTSRMSATQKAMLLHNQQLFFLRQKDFGAAIVVANELIIFLQSVNERDIIPIHFAVIVLTIAIINIHLQHWDIAEQYLEKTIRLKNSSSPQMYNSARLLYLLIYYEKGEFLMMPHSVRGLYRSLYKEKHLYPFERLILQGLRRLVDCADETAKQKVLSQLAKKLDKLVATATAIELEPLQYFDYIYWLSCKQTKQEY